MEKLLLKIVLAIGLFCTSPVYAADYMQIAKISLDLKNATYEEAFKAIEDQTEFTFFYDENEFDSGKRISLKVENEGITSVLNKMFDKLAISYKITDRHVVLYKPYRKEKKNESVVENQSKQLIIVSGIVSDETGEPSIGVTVVSSSKKATITDENGCFTLQVDDGEELTFTYIGYLPQKVMARPVLNVRLEPSDIGLEEIVVVAYGKQKKASVTGAIAQVSTRELKQSPAANLSASLAGRLPGLTALQISGQPGVDEVNLYLRGVGTTNGNSPLILIDGVPRSNISRLDPNEVASISILKDASATAVFGVRGANGVILITTKRGHAGEDELIVSIDRSIQQFTISPRRVHSWEYAQLRNEAQANIGAAPVYSDYQIAKYKDGSDPVFYPDRFPYEEFYSSFAPQTRVNANLNGGSNTLSYFVNAGYINQGSNLKTEKQKDLGYDPAFKMNRYNFRGNLDFQAAGNLKLSLNLASYLQKHNAPKFDDDGDENWAMIQLLQNTITADPTEVGPLTQAGYTTPSGVLVPANEVVGRPGGGTYGKINRQGYKEQTQSVLNSSFTADWDLDFLTKGLTTKFMIAFDSDANTTLIGRRSFAYYNYEAATKEDGKNYYIDNNAALVNPNITLDKVMYSSYYMNLQYSINYAHSFDKHNLTGLLLFQRDNWDSQSGDLPFNVIGLANRFTYAYSDRYFAEVNMGYNGSEQFAPENRFGFFPAFSAAYVISNEKFWNKSVVNNLKLRASYGLVGNDKMGGVRFLYDSENSLNGGSFTPSLGRGGVISQGKIGNDMIQWEVAEKQNFGLDLQLWESLSLTVDLFKEHRDKILIKRGLVPELQGVPLDNLPLVNMGVVDNKGYEIELAYVKRFNKDLMINIRGNYAFARNKVKYFDESPFPEDYACRYRRTGYYVEGHETHWANRFGYKIDKTNGSGYITTPEELAWANGAYTGSSVTYGDFLYMDINGDGLVNDADKVLLAYPTVPEISYGFSGMINYKNLDFSFLFSGIANCSMTYPETIYRYSESGYNHAWTRERWNNGESIRYPALKPENRGASYMPNEFFTFDRTYLRLKTVELGYTLPKDWLKPVGIKSCRIYMNGNNLLTFTKFPLKTVDPEQAGTGDYPIQKMYNLGVNVVF